MYDMISDMLSLHAIGTGSTNTIITFVIWFDQQSLKATQANFKTRPMVIIANTFVQISLYPTGKC